LIPLRSQNKVAEARRVFKDASQRKGLDWAEAIWERWVLFEYQFGTVEEVSKTLIAVKEFKKIEDARRKKAWEAHAQAQVATYAPSDRDTNGATQAAAAPVIAVPDSAEAPMDIDAESTVVGERSLKRKRSVDEDVELSPNPKKSKHGESADPVVQAEPHAREVFFFFFPVICWALSYLLLSVAKVGSEAEKPALKRSGKVIMSNDDV